MPHFAVTFFLVSMFFACRPPHDAGPQIDCATYCGRSSSCGHGLVRTCEASCQTEEMAVPPRCLEYVRGWHDCVSNPFRGCDAGFNPQCDLTACALTVCIISGGSEVSCAGNRCEGGGHSSVCQ